MKKRVVFEYSLTSESDKEAIICITADVYIPDYFERNVYGMPMECESETDVIFIDAHFIDSHGNAMSSIAPPDNMPESVLQDWKDIAVETVLALKNNDDEEEY
jgi:hypothetical protein